MPKLTGSRRRFRLMTAYGVTLRVLLSFGGFFLLAKLLGPQWREARSDIVYLRNARRIKTAILNLKGLFIKVGQLISIMSNFVPAAFREELEELQDRIPPRPYEEIAQRITEELGSSPDTLFTAFDPQPLASASLAQVHRAQLADGTPVAVKVQYVDIELLAQLDLRIIARILTVVGLIFRVKGLNSAFDQLKAMILDELDFTREAAHLEKIAANFSGDASIHFPEVHHSLSSTRVMTTTYIDGVKISDIEQLGSLSIDRSVLAEKVVTAYCQMIFVDGFYHADPHPGNILVLADGDVVFLDFGAVAQLSSGMKSGLIRFLKAVIRHDREEIAAAFQEMGFIPFHENSYDVEQMIDYIYQNFINQLTLESWQLSDIKIDTKMKMEMFSDMRDLGISFRELMTVFQVPRDWILLERTILLLVGLCTHLDPRMNPLKIIRPYLENYVFGESSGWMQLVTDVLKDAVLSVLTLPAQLKSLLNTANRGELAVRVPDVSANADILYAVGHQFLYGFLAMGLGTMSYVTHLNADHSISQLLLYGAGFFALCLGWSLLAARRLRKRRHHS